MIKITSRLLALLLFGLVATGCASVSTPEESALPVDALAEAQQKSLEQAAAIFDDGHYANAASAYRRVLRSAPDSLEARLGLAESLLASGSLESAAEAFREVSIRTDDRNALAAQGEGMALLLSGDTEKAVSRLRHAVEQDTQLWRSWNALGRCHDAKQEWTKAEDAYDRALAAAPETAKALISNNLGMSAMLRRDYGRAADHFGNAVDQDPQLDTARLNLRIALAFQGQYAAAMAGTGPTDLAPALNNLGFVALLKGDYGRAEAYFLRALESSPSFYSVASENLRLLASLEQVRTSSKD